jgi:hypothetical protein
MPINVAVPVRFRHKVDLLAATADAPAATWDQKGEAETNIVFNPTIH